MARERRDRGDGDSRDNALVDFVVKIRRSACVVKGGRRFSFNALVVVGDKQGRVAYGYGKANEVPPAVDKAVKDATGMMRREKKVMLTGATIPHRVVGKYGASRVVLVPAGPGTGVKAGPGVRDVLECAGVRNILMAHRDTPGLVCRREPHLGALERGDQLVGAWFERRDLVEQPQRRVVCAQVGA